MILNLNGRPVNGEATEPPAPLEECTLVPLRAAPNDLEAQKLAGQRYQMLQQHATADQHVVVAPTHVMLRGEEVIGYVSLGAMPCVHFWLDSTVKNPRQSRDLIRHAETVMRENGVREYFVACAKTSPFFPNMMKLGFHLMGETTLWAKQLKR